MAKNQSTQVVLLLSSRSNHKVIMELPSIDLSSFLTDPSDPQLKTLCEHVSRTLSDTDALLVKNPRCYAEDNYRFIDSTEKYFELSREFKRLQEIPNLITR